MNILSTDQLSVVSGGIISYTTLGPNSYKIEMTGEFDEVSEWFFLSDGGHNIYLKSNGTILDVNARKYVLGIDGYSVDITKNGNFSTFIITKT